MPDYTYEALAKTGQKQTGTLTAGSEREAASVLDSRGLFPIKIASVSRSGEGGGFSLFSGVSKRETALIYGQLADLLNSGVPLLRALEILERQTTNKRLSSTMRDVRLKVADGTSLSQAMGAHPKVFDELAVSMVRAGQEGGFLEDVLTRIASFVEHQEDLKAKVIGALAYPVFLAGAGMIVLNILMIFFVPKFEPIFAKLREKNELPMITVWVTWVSHTMQSKLGLLIAVLFVIAVVAFFKWAKGPGRATMDAVKIRLPLFGKVFLALSLSRFTRIFGTMLQNGIPILKALTIAKDSTGNRVLSDAIALSAENVTSGQKLADPLRRCKYFPGDVVEMIAIGEEANTLEKVLINISDSLEKRTARNLELMVKLLEPLMLLVMAGVILIVVAGLLLPVFKMGQAVK
ncbi:type II secretion system F family protein [Limnoglobus roseus]|uniref:General secretion pathway protein F n=1 Tax=Limnoglobus roseus TaxID=2598579 RepID=A0A5C1ALF0_9BACT|nr:type II secretion system F family protein [Limnoglobus roseus]QEL18796.1 type II secretion system F family protein [Limnoglobus roseus]